MTPVGSEGKILQEFQEAKTIQIQTTTLLNDKSKATMTPSASGLENTIVEETPKVPETRTSPEVSILARVHLPCPWSLMLTGCKTIQPRAITNKSVELLDLRASTAELVSHSDSAVRVRLRLYISSYR